MRDHDYEAKLALELLGVMIEETITDYMNLHDDCNDIDVADMTDNVMTTVQKYLARRSN